MAAVAVKSLLQVEKGSPYPLGATPDQNGVNFSLYLPSTFPLPTIPSSLMATESRSLSPASTLRGD